VWKRPTNYRRHPSSFSVYIDGKPVAQVYTSWARPGFFPLWLAVIMGILSASHAIPRDFGKSESLPADFFASKGRIPSSGALCASLIWIVITMGSARVFASPWRSSSCGCN